MRPSLLDVEVLISRMQLEMKVLQRVNTFLIQDGAIIEFVHQMHSTSSGGRLNIKMSSYQYRDSHVKDKTVSPTVLSLTWESPYLGKMVFILRRGPGSLGLLWQTSPNGMGIYRQPSTSRRDSVVHFRGATLAMTRGDTIELSQSSTRKYTQAPYISEGASENAWSCMCRMVYQWPRVYLWDSPRFQCIKPIHPAWETTLVLRSDFIIQVKSHNKSP